MLKRSKLEEKSILFMFRADDFEKMGELQNQQTFHNLLHKI